jgi:hypothetical protein
MLTTSRSRERRRISDLDRRRIAASQNYLCTGGCGALLPPEFQIDHIVSLGCGGADEVDNMQALCCNCHARKTADDARLRGALFRQQIAEAARNCERNEEYLKKCPRGRAWWEKTERADVGTQTEPACLAVRCKVCGVVTSPFWGGCRCVEAGPPAWVHRRLRDSS